MNFAEDQEPQEVGFSMGVIAPRERPDQDGEDPEKQQLL